MAADGTDGVTTARGPGRLRIATWALLLVGLVGAVVGAVAFAAEAVTGGDGGSSSAEQAAVTVASDFAVAYNTYDAADLADYQERVEPLLTEDYRAEFVEVTDALFPTLAAKQQVSTDATVRSVAVDEIDDRAATVLVAVDAALTNTDNAVAVARYFRWVLTLERTGDDWRVAQFLPVAGAEALVQDGPAPEAAP